MGTVAVYESHSEALNAIEKLKEAGFPLNKVSLLGKADVIDDHLHVNTLQEREGKRLAIPVSIGATFGALAGLLTGVGLFLIPGLGFLYGAGAAVGAFAGFDFGLVSGGFVSVLTTLGMKKDNALKYKEHIEEGKFIIMAQGTDEEVEDARKILASHGEHVSLEKHVG